METMDSRELGRLRQKCFSFSRTLFAYKRDFRFSLRVGSFEMSFEANGASGGKAGLGCGRKRNPAYLRRQKRRRQAFLEKKRGLARDSLGTGAEAEVGGARDGEVDEEVSGREREQKEDMTIEDLCKLFVEESEITRKLMDSLKADFWTANDPERRDEGREGELQGSDEDAEDHLIEFASRLETGIKCFQRQVETTDKKVEEARRLTRTTPQSPRRKRRRKR